MFLRHSSSYICFVSEAPHVILYRSPEFGSWCTFVYTSSNTDNSCLACVINQGHSLYQCRRTFFYSSIIIFGLVGRISSLLCYQQIPSLCKILKENKNGMVQCGTMTLCNFLISSLNIHVTRIFICSGSFKSNRQIVFG